MTDKFCKNCQHFRPAIDCKDDDVFEYARCGMGAKPSAEAERLVRGYAPDRPEDFRYAAAMRMQGSACGPKGKLFESRDEA